MRAGAGRKTDRTSTVRNGGSFEASRWGCQGGARHEAPSTYLDAGARNAAGPACGLQRERLEES